MSFAIWVFSAVISGESIGSQSVLSVHKYLVVVDVVEVVGNHIELISLQCGYTFSAHCKATSEVTKKKFDSILVRLPGGLFQDIHDVICALNRSVIHCSDDGTP